MSRDGWRKKASDDDGWGGRGGYMAAKVAKLEAQFHLDAPREQQRDGASSSMFSGVAIYVNGYTEPSADELRRLMLLHGGQFHVYYSRSQTTHIIATNLPTSKIRELRGEKVVRPEWITDSIQAGRRLSWLQYQLYAKQAGLSFGSVAMQKVPEPSGAIPSLIHPDQTDRRPSQTQSITRPGPAAGGAGRTAHVRVNASVGDNYELIGENSRVNGVHDWARQDSSGRAKGWLTNGHARPLNGALKADAVSDPKRAHHGSGSTPPAPAQPSCSTPESHQRPTTPTTPSPKPPPPQPVSHHTHDPDWPCPQGPPLPFVKSHQGSSSGPDQPPPQDAASRVRPNGSHSDVPPLLNAALPDNSDQSDTAVTQRAEPGIISEFYSHSRLHHISTWRSEFTEYVSSLQSRRRAAGGAIFPGKEKLRRLCGGRVSPPASCVLHVDMDCFFVSVGIRHRADLAGKPVAVTSNRGAGQVAQRAGANPQLEHQYYQRKLNQPPTESRGDDLEMTPWPEGQRMEPEGAGPDFAALSMAEIASCSYEARQAGVRNGMFFGHAKRLCPALQAVPYDFQAYKDVASAMYETLASYTHNIEALSCDEALLDASTLLAEVGATPEELARAIRADVRERTGCCASVGMGSNILLARMATRKAKPDGKYFLRSEEVDDFIRDQPVTSLPGVGRSMGSKLASLGVSTCGDLQQISMVRLQRAFGPRTGQTLFRFCRGLDDRPVRSNKERKSVSAEMNYNIRFTQVREAEAFLTDLSTEVQKRLEGAGLRGRRVTLKVMMRKPGAPVEPAKYGGHGICDNLSRSVLLPRPTDRGHLIAQEVIKLFHCMRLDVTDMRGVGLQVQQLEGFRRAPPDPPGSRSITALLLAQAPRESQPGPDTLLSASSPGFSSNQDQASSDAAPPPSPSDPMPGTSRGEPPPGPAPRGARTRLNLSIEVPSPSQVDRSVLEALPAELREQVEQSWSHRGAGPGTTAQLSPPPQSFSTPPTGTLLLQLPPPAGQAGTGILLELPDLSQVDPEVFAALPRELQDELRSAYERRETVPLQAPSAESRNPLLQLKQPAAVKAKRRYKRKNISPAKKGPSPLKRRLPGNGPPRGSPAKPAALPFRPRDAPSCLKSDHGPSSSAVKQPERPPVTPRRPVPALAGACELGDIRTLLREWVTTISEPMEEDILQVVRYCTELVEDKDLEKLDLVIKYMKRLMQQSVESVWSMAFDFILDNVQVVVQQTYGSTLKIT